MFSFLPQALIVISVAGIIIIVLRRRPGLVPPRFWAVWGQELLGWIRLGSEKLWKFVLEVKELSKTRGFNYLPKKLPRFHIPHIPKAKLPFFRSHDSPEYYVEEAKASLEREDYANAERQFIKVIEKDPKNREAYEGLGKLYLAQKSYQEAIETYKFLLKNHPDNDIYHANLGQAYHGQKLYDLAQEAYERAIELGPENAKRYVNLGLTLEARRHLEEAILNYKKAVVLEKENTQFLLVLSEALVKKGDKEEAELILEQVLQVEPTNHLAREKLMQLKF